MSYSLHLSDKFKEDTKKLKKSDSKLLKKVLELIIDVSNHPATGIGKPEELKGNLSGWWSRRIDQKHRLIYRFDEETEEVFINSCYGHYDDK